MLPIIKGYVIYGKGDVLSHIGVIKDVLRTGHVSSDDIYPLFRISGAIFSLFSSINLYDISKIYPIFLSSVFYFLTSFIFSKIIFKNIKIAIFSLIFITIPLFQGYQNIFAPYQQAFFLLPLSLFIYFKNIRTNINKTNLFLFLFFCSFMLFSHPLIALSMIVIIFIIETAYCLYVYIFPYKYDFNVHKINIYILITLCISFFIWRSYSNILLFIVKKIYSNFFILEEASDLQSYIELISHANISFQNIILIIFNMYGQWIVMGVLSIVSIFYFIFIIRKKINYINIFIIIGYLAFIFISFITFISYPIVGFIRFIIIATIFSIFIITSFYHQLIKKTLNYISYKKFTFIIILLLMLLPINYYSIFNIHYSPITRTSNQQVTYTELTGMNSFFTFRDKQISILELGISVYRFYIGLYGDEAIKQNIELAYDLSNVPITHFGYSNHTSFSDSYKTEKYFILNKQGKIEYPSLYPEYKPLWKFNDDDFNKIKNDFGVNLSYMNGNLEIYLL